jgi:hypothetical protein
MIFKKLGVLVGGALLVIGSYVVSRAIFDAPLCGILVAGGLVAVVGFIADRACHGELEGRPLFTWGAWGIILGILGVVSAFKQ